MFSFCHLAVYLRQVASKAKKTMITTHIASEPTVGDPLRYQDLDSVADSFGLDTDLKQQIFGISPRTQARLKKDNGILNSLVTDRLNRFNRITQQAIDLFEDAHRARKWLQTPKQTLAGLTPLAALATDEGSKQVEEILYRTEYGIYS
jgi:putative toxin-antitoxin system antitoxin component (TIGR02293 family)